MSRKVLAGVIAAIVVLAAVYVLFKPPAGIESSEPRIGSLLILSGDYAPYGQQIERGQELAELWLKGQGLAVERIQPVDFEGDKTKAEILLLRQFRQDGVSFYAGLMGTGTVEHCAPKVTENKILVVDGTATGDKLSGISPGFFRTIPADGEAARQVVGWVAGEGQTTSLMLLWADTSWGSGLKDSYLEALKEQGLVLAEDAIIKLPENASDTQIEAAAQTVRDRAPSAVLLAVYGTEAASLMRALTEGGESAPPVYGTDNLVGEFAEKGGSYVAGARYVIAKGGEIDPAVRALYVERFGQPEGGEIPAYVITGFNAFVAAARAYEASNGDPVAARAWLQAATIRGAEGEFGFNENGDFSGLGYERRKFILQDDKPLSTPWP